MAQISQGPRALMNSDGNAHPRENTLTLVTAALGVVALFTAFAESLHLVASWAGLAGVVVGACSMMLSATPVQRFVTVVGVGAAALGLYLGMSHGGLFGGVIG